MNRTLSLGGVLASVVLILMGVGAIVIGAMGHTSCSVADKPIETSADAKCFAENMRIHALEATGGQTYAEMRRFASEDGKGTNEAGEDEKRPDGSPVDNPARNVWVTQTALGTALNTSFFAQQVALA